MQPLTDFMICGFEMPLPLWTSWLCPHQIHNPARTGQAHHLDSAEEASANHRGWLWQTNKPTEMRTPWPHSRASVFCNLVTLAYFFSSSKIYNSSILRESFTGKARTAFEAIDVTFMRLITPLSFSFPRTLFDKVGLSFFLWAFFSSLIHEAWWEMPANDIQLGKGYISPSALQFAAVWPLTKPCLGIITVCSLSYRQVDPMWDKYKESPEVVQERKSQRRKRTKLMLVCAAAM